MKRYDLKTRPKPKPRPLEFGGKAPEVKPPIKPAGVKPPAAKLLHSAKPVRTKSAPRSQAPLHPHGGPRPVGPRPIRRGEKPATHWGGVAKWYDQLVGEAGSEYQQKVVIPGMMSMLKPEAGRRVLDVACGQGVLCRAMAEHGAEVMGVDASRQLIEMARQRGGERITYAAGDARSLKLVGGVKAGAFDAATMMLAIQDMDPIEPVFEGVAWALAGGGAFVMAMMHPAFRGPKATSWGWDATACVQYRRVDRYMVPRREQIVSHPGRNTDEFTWSFHRPLSSYIGALGRAGLAVVDLQEWVSHKHSGSGPRARSENNARKEIPLFLAIRAVKLATPRSEE